MSPVAMPLVAVVAGVISFTSPCCLPLLPSYLSFISGLPVSELGQRESRAVTLRAALLFVAGFTLVFTALGASFAFVGSLLIRNLPLILRVAGVGISALGLVTLGTLHVPWLARERRLDLGRMGRGPRTAFPLGMAYAFGWAPCIGPVLATLLTLAAATETVAWGAALLALYSIGLGVPFVLLAIGFQRARGSVDWLRRHGRAVETVGGALLVVVGILFVTGAWRSFFIPLQREFARLGWPPV
ncbi:MAG: cytochrome c biogenesis CcdA family protein [Acidimicrobiia bacterium]